MKQIIISCLIGLALGGCAYDKTVNQTPAYYHINQSQIMSASFADETYIWENWIPTTNKVERFN